MVKVLLADDDGAMRDFAARTLQAEGHAVVAVHDGQEALDQAQGVRFDLEG